MTTRYGMLVILDAGAFQAEPAGVRPAGWTLPLDELAHPDDPGARLGVWVGGVSRGGFPDASANADFRVVILY